MKKTIELIRPYFFLVLGVVLLVLAVLDWDKPLRMVGELFSGLLILFLGIGQKADQDDEQAGKVTQDERDDYVTKQTDHVTLAVIDYALLAVVIGCSAWYFLDGKLLIAGVLAVGALLLWLAIGLVKVITGLLVDSRN